VLGVGYVYTVGDILFDPVLTIEDAEVEQQALIVSYVRSFGVLGKIARLDVTVPQMNAQWDGLLGGSPVSRERQGLGDPRIRLSLNLTGPPAAKPKEFREYLASHPVYTVLGVGLAVNLPLGDYEDDKLLNLGQNRFVIRPQLGVLHRRGPWSWELTASTFFQTSNDDFFMGTELDQDPLYAVQAHSVRTFGAGWWASLGAAYGWEGESRIDGVNKDDEKRIVLFGASIGLPVGRNQGVRVGYLGGRTHGDTGVNTDSLLISWSFRF